MSKILFPPPLLQKDVNKYRFFLHTNRFSVVYKSSEGRGPCPPAPHPLSRGRGGGRGSIRVHCTYVNHSVQAGPFSKSFRGIQSFFIVIGCLGGVTGHGRWGGGGTPRVRFHYPPPFYKGDMWNKLKVFPT